MTRYVTIMFSAALALPLLAVAQERTAGGNLQTEATWTALKNATDQANGNAKMALSLAEAIKNCGMKGLVYAPGMAGADSTGCKAAAAPDPATMDIKSYTKTLCSRSTGPFTVVASCPSGETLLSCSGGPGDQDESHEYWILEPDFKNRRCIGRVQQPRCHTDESESSRYYSQTIVTAICYKP